jgi:hypothetical protein
MNLLTVELFCCHPCCRQINRQLGKVLDEKIERGGIEKSSARKREWESMNKIIKGRVNLEFIA